MTVTHGKPVCMASAHPTLTSTRRGGDGERAGQHRQRVGADEAGLGPPQPGAGPTDAGREAVDHAVDPAVVEEHQRPGEVLRPAA